MAFRQLPPTVTAYIHDLTSEHWWFVDRQNRHQRLYEFTFQTAQRNETPQEKLRDAFRHASVLQHPSHSTKPTKRTNLFLSYLYI